MYQFGARALSTLVGSGTAVPQEMAKPNESVTRMVLEMLNLFSFIPCPQQGNGP